MASETENQAYQYDAFISYSRKDRSFAEKLERALEGFKPPKGLDVPQRPLNIFRDEQDMTGTEYHRAVEGHLRNSKKQIVICSPEARQSKYVDEEIRRFAELRGPGLIISVLLSGVPNNEATKESEKAFPEALAAAILMPLAIPYREYDARTDRIDEAGLSTPGIGCWQTSTM